VYNGNKKDYLEWKRKTQLFIFANTLHLKTNLDKVLCTVSYMSGKRAGRWATAYIETIMATSALPTGTNYEDWVGFKKKVLRLDNLYQFRLRDKQEL